MKEIKVVLVFFTAMCITTSACSKETKETKLAVKVVNDTTRVYDTTETSEAEQKSNSMNIKIGDKVLTATLVDNSSVEALKEALAKAPITVDMRDYGNMEKVGSLGQNFPRNDESITAEAGDIILYQGNALVIYYASNSWSFTRLGKIDNISQKELKGILGEGNVTVTLSLPHN
jgi:hypothetical protein